MGKKTQKTEESVVPAEKEPMVIDQVTLQKMLRFDAELRATQIEIASNQAQMKELLARIDPEGKVIQFNTTIQQAQQKHLFFRSKYIEIIKDLERKFGIKMSEYAFDDETGVLRFVQEAPASEPEPVKSA